MAKIKLRFTEDELALISAMHSGLIKVEHHKSTLGRDVNEIVRVFNLNDAELDDQNLLLLREKMEKLGDVAAKSAVEAQMDVDRYYGIDTYDLFGGTDWKTAVKLACPDTSAMTEEEIDEKCNKLSEKFIDNIEYIEQLVHQRSNKGGLQPDVTYVCIDRVGIWYTEIVGYRLVSYLKRRTPSRGYVSVFFLCGIYVQKTSALHLMNHLNALIGFRIRDGAFTADNFGKVGPCGVLTHFGEEFVGKRRRVHDMLLCKRTELFLRLFLSAFGLLLRPFALVVFLVFGHDGLADHFPDSLAQHVLLDALSDHFAYLVF